MTRIVCTADLHENLIEIPDCDVLLIAGDVSFAFKGACRQAGVPRRPVQGVARAGPAAEIVLVAGNHDQSIEAWGMPDGLRCHYLEDAGTELFGLRIWGTPWQPWFYDWAFNAPRRHGEAFSRRSSSDSRRHRHPDLPRAATWIRRSHRSPDGQPHVGSTALTEAIRRLQPRLMVCGHIHSGYGRYRLGVTEIINAALVNNNYEPSTPSSRSRFFLCASTRRGLRARRLGRRALADGSLRSRSRSATSSLVSDVAK